MTTIFFLGNRGNYKASIAAYLSTAALFEKGSISETPCSYPFSCHRRRFLICDVYPTRETLSSMQYPNCNIFFIFHAKSCNRAKYLYFQELIEDIYEKTNDNAIVIEMDAPKNLEEVPVVAEVVLRVLSSLPRY